MFLFETSLRESKDHLRPEEIRSLRAAVDISGKKQFTEIVSVCVMLHVCNVVCCYP